MWRWLGRLDTPMTSAMVAAGGLARFWRRLRGEGSGERGYEDGERWRGDERAADERWSGCRLLQSAATWLVHAQKGCAGRASGEGDDRLEVEPANTTRPRRSRFHSAVQQRLRVRACKCHSLLALDQGPLFCGRRRLLRTPLHCSTPGFRFSRDEPSLSKPMKPCMRSSTKCCIAQVCTRWTGSREATSVVSQPRHSRHSPARRGRPAVTNSQRSAQRGRPKQGQCPVPTPCDMLVSWVGSGPAS